MWTNEENVVVKDRNKNAQRFLLIKNVGKIKNVKKRVFYFKIKNVKNVFNIYDTPYKLLEKLKSACFIIKTNSEQVCL